MGRSNSSHKVTWSLEWGDRHLQGYAVFRVWVHGNYSLLRTGRIALCIINLHKSC